MGLSNFSWELAGHLNQGASSGSYYTWLDSTLAPSVTATLSGGTVAVTSPIALPLNAWSHVPVTYDGAAVRLFINAVQVASVAGTGTLPAGLTNLVLGDRPGGYVLNGMLDEVRIYQRALAASDTRRPQVSFQSTSATPTALGVRGFHKRLRG
jgi:concanavalin A-like lectin/glucanase superfamily protein